MTLPGLDISRWQATTPPLGGFAYVFVKASEGLTPDPDYAMHAANVKRAGCRLFAYHFGDSTIDPAAQAREFVAASPGARARALDVEGTRAMSQAQIDTFLATTKSLDPAPCGVYHSLSGWPVRAGDFRWVAEWGSAAPAIPWDFWQDTSSYTEAGYSGRLDHDVWRGDAAALDALIGGTMAISTTITVLPNGGGTVSIPAGKAVSGFTIDAAGAIVPGSTFGPSSKGSSAHYDATMTTNATRGGPFVRFVDGALAGQFAAAAGLGLTPNPDPTPFDQTALSDAHDKGYAEAKSAAAVAVAAI